MDSKQLLLPTSVPSSLVLADVEDDGHALPKSGGVRRLSLGMFQVAYGPPMRHFSLKSFRESLRELRRSAPCATRLLLEIYSTARTAVTVHVLAAMLLIISPAYSLYLSATILGVVEETVLSRKMTDLDVSMLQGLVFHMAVRRRYEHPGHPADTALILKGYLRAHFLPELVDASLRLDLPALQSQKAIRSLPGDYGFEWEIPGFAFFDEIVTRLRNFLTVVGEVGVLALIICRRGLHEAQLLAFFSLMLPAIMLLKPSSGVGGAGWVFWATNHNFYYLAALHKIAFSHDFRPTLARDGLCAYISQEYKRISAELGYLNVETISLQSSIQVRLYWDLLHAIVVDYPLALCALILPWVDPLSTLVSMVLVQHASTTLKESIRMLRENRGPDTLLEVLGWAKRLYEAVALESELNRGTAEYPRPWSSTKGMNITFRNVSFRHREGAPLAVSDVDFEIPAGSLAVVVGANGSGKSSLLSLLPRLQEPSAGEILIDDKPLAEYDIDSLRGAMACLSQDEEMYPVTLRQNMLMGRGRDIEADAEILRAAAHMGRATDLIERLPLKYDTILDPAAVAAQSMQGCGIGHVSDAAMRELEAHGPSFLPTPVSGGEKQRLAATRMFSRLLQRKDCVRLIVCDEATGAVDSCAERDILRNMKELGAGHTTRIFVTHRFGDLVKEADIILVMKEGRLVQRGTHTELMQEALQSGGCREYADMYLAQADRIL
ncbi:P-loop containing nucleoside triphosphate hydrolase protein [Mycena olivaceomarginata]|nr:P-loop containing nucleoside triphosphate hydrolase protein [Mycena olivaceomarginata]